VERVAELCRTEHFRWADLANAAAEHKLGPVVLGNIVTVPGCPECVPDGLMTAWKMRTAVNALAKQRQAGVVRDVIAFFTERDARVMLLKGVALDAALYGNAWSTQAGDADLLVDVPYDSLDKSAVRKLEDLTGGHGVELNYQRHHDLDMNEVLQIDYAHVWSNARSITYHGESAFVMSPEDMLLTASINLCRKRYLTLKGMVSVQDVLRAFPMDWDTLLRHAGACGAARILYAAITIAAETLGDDLPAHEWRRAIPRNPRRALVDRLCRSMAKRLVHIPVPSGRSPVDRLTSTCLQSLTYQAVHFARELRAHRDLRRYHARVAAGTSST
jgi:hypothetical protein